MNCTSIDTIDTIMIDYLANQFMAGTNNTKNGDSQNETSPVSMLPPDVVQQAFNNQVIPSRQAEEKLHQAKISSSDRSNVNFNQLMPHLTVQTTDEEAMDVDQTETIPKSGKWSRAEARKLQDLISERGGNPVDYNTPTWKQFAAELKTRTVAQIKDHWFHSLDPNIKRGQWNAAEDKIIRTYGQKMGWKAIADSLPGRTGVQIKDRYRVLSKRKKPSVSNVPPDVVQQAISNPATPSLQAAEKLYQAKVSSSDRSNVNFYQPMPQLTVTTPDKEAMNVDQRDTIPSPGKWSSAEVRKLEDLISEQGGNPVDYNMIVWKQFAAEMKTRTVYQIKEHWFESLDPNIKRGPWTAPEDQILIEKVYEIEQVLKSGKILKPVQKIKWAKIAKNLPGRTRHQISSRYNHHLQGSELEKQFLQAKMQKLVEKGTSPIGSQESQ